MGDMEGAQEGEISCVSMDLVRFDGPREVGTEKLLSARGVESDGVRVVVRACARCGSGGDGKGWRSRMGDMEGAEAGEISCVSMDPVRFDGPREAETEK